jgi:hypothetical protein
MKKIKNNERGQLTIFVLVAIVIVVAIIGYFLLNSEGESEINSEIKLVYDVVKNCVKDISSEALIVIGESGGYYDLPEKVNSIGIAYYFYEDEVIMPGIDVIEFETGKYVDDFLFFCVEEGYLGLTDYEISSREIMTSVNVFEDTVEFSVDYSFSVVKDNKTYLIDEPFVEVYSSRLFEIHSFISKIMQWQKEEPRAFCVNCISDEANRLGLFIDLWDSSEDDVLFFVTDEENVVNGKSYKFFFVNKYIGGNYDPFEDL